jgi:hypothetical protein
MRTGRSAEPRFRSPPRKWPVPVIRHPRFMKKRTAKTATITTTMASTIVVSVIGFLRYGPAQSSKAGMQPRSFRYPCNMNKRHTNAGRIAEVTTNVGLTSLAWPCRAKGASLTFGRYGENGVLLRQRVFFPSSDAFNLRSTWGAVRCRPVTSSQHPPGARQVGQRMASTFFASQVPHSGDMMYQIQAGEWSILDSCGNFQPGRFGHLQGEGWGWIFFIRHVMI